MDQRHKYYCLSHIVYILKGQFGRFDSKVVLSMVKVIIYISVDLLLTKRNQDGVIMSESFKY